MKLCVFGCGAVGGHIALRAHLGGAETSAVARGETLAAIRARGLTVQTPDGDLHARIAASDDPAALGPQDAVIVTVKAPALASVAKALVPLLHDRTMVVFAMNGIPWWYFMQHGGPWNDRRLPTLDPGDALWSIVGTSRTLGGSVYAASRIVEPGVVRLASRKNRLLVGEPDGRVSDRVTALAGLLTTGGLPTEASAAIRDDVWTKLANNVASGLLAILTQAPVQRFAVEPPCEAMMRDMVAETIAVAEAFGCRPDRDIDALIASKRGLAHKPSILQDLEAGREMEMEATYVALLRLARLAGVKTPALDLAITLARLRAEEAGLARIEPL
jgi:2-dehydropantoate 2-reductase